jgi:hypothetical protein
MNFGAAVDLTKIEKNEDTFVDHIANIISMEKTATTAAVTDLFVVS